MTNAGWALSWAAISGIIRPHNSSVSIGVDPSLVDKPLLEKGLMLMNRGAELARRDAEEDPETASRLSMLLVELGKLQLLLDSDGKPRDATVEMTQRARAWIEEARLVFLQSSNGDCVDCDVSIRQVDNEELGNKRTLDTSGSDTLAVDSQANSDTLSAQIDYTGVRVSPDWSLEVRVVWRIATHKRRRRRLALHPTWALARSRTDFC